jgi:hypothetical protein
MQTAIFRALNGRGPMDESQLYDQVRRQAITTGVVGGGLVAGVLGARVLPLGVVGGAVAGAASVKVFMGGFHVALADLTARGVVDQRDEDGSVVYELATHTKSGDTPSTSAGAGPAG